MVFNKEKHNLQSTILLLLLTGSITFNYFKTSEVNQTKEKNEELNETIKLDHIENSSLKKENDKFKKLLDHQEDKRKSIKDKFRKVNPDIDNKFINLFIDVSDHYDLHPHESYDLFISQLLVESRGRQHYKNGKVITGLAGEIGIGQIIPSTALFFIKHKISKSEKQKMVLLGSDDLSNIKTEDQARTWLTSRDNNIVLWGFIMNYNIKRAHGTVSESFVAYNTGFGGLHKFKSNGHAATEHSYYKRIKKMSLNI